MNNDQNLAPCGHLKSDTWDGCDVCASDFRDRRGGHPLGRHHLLGLAAGLAFDFHDDGRVVAYMLHADTVVGDSGGWWGAWVTNDEWLSQAPDVQVAEPVHYLLPGQTAEELADFCGYVSDLATAFRPLVQHAIDSDEPEGFLAGFVTWLDQRGTKPNIKRLALLVVHFLALALVRREMHQLEEEGL